MSARLLRWIIALGCLLSIPQGCRGISPDAEPIPTSSSITGPPTDGQPFDRLRSRQAENSQLSSSAVRHASAVEPITPDRGEGQPVPNAPDAARSSEVEEEEHSGFKLSDLYPSNVYENVKELAGYGPDEELARALYEEGEELYRQEKYLEAAEKFKAAAARWPDSPLEEDALFMAGESFFFADRYSKANDTYAKLLKKHDYSRHLDKIVTRLFAIGRYWEQTQEVDPAWPITPNLLDNSRPLFDTWGHAIKAYDMARMHDPTGPLADDSVMATANAHFLRGRYEEAAYHYDLLRKEYAKSEHQIPAHVLAMESKLAMYQGPMYDGASLVDAGKLAEQTLLQFRGSLGDEQELVVQTKNRVVEQQAARDWAMAQYYENRKYYGAARFYYQTIMKDYPETSVAQKARLRLEEIADLPDEPPNRFKWLTDLFPSGND